MDTIEDVKPEAAQKPDQEQDALAQSAKLARKWSTELNASKRWMDKFTTAGRKWEKKYLGPGSGDDERTFTAGTTNLFWSNVQVVLSAIYGRLPKATVDRKFKDYDDDVARVAGIIMQRVLNSDMDREWDDTSSAMRDAVQDRYVVGMGQVWCRYEVDIELVDEPVVNHVTKQPSLDPATGQPLMQKVEKIVAEEAETDYVYWEDFRYSPCRRWRDCRWVARRVYMTKERLAQRFKLTDVQLGMVPMQARTQGDGGLAGFDDVHKATPFQQAAVWEIWEKEGNYVCWYVEGSSFVLDRQDDPLQLEQFFPCPQPITATTLTKNYLPRADYAMAQDLYRELDRVNAKLSHLTEAVKAAGVYDKSAGVLRDLMKPGNDNQLLPVDNWSAFIERGGMKGVIDWFPIEAFVNAIVQLNARKAQLQHDLYEVLGLSDIMRGVSAASETATAQQLKVQYGGARLANHQNDVARFVSEVMRIRANIISNHFQPETILERSQIERTADAPYAQPAIEMLKDFGTAMFSIQVTSDSLAAPDWAAEKEARSEFLGAASNYIMAAVPMLQQAPQMGAFLIKLLQWAAAGFRGAETIEGVLDQAAKQLELQANTPEPPPQPTPEDRKNEAQAAKATAEAERTKKEADLIPPIQMTPGGPQPGGPQPGGPQQMGAGPGTVPPMQPMPPAPLNGAPPM